MTKGPRGIYCFVLFGISVLLCTFSYGNIPIADSAAEYSGTQGQDNWYYGYYDGDSIYPYTNNPAGDDFEQFSDYGFEDRWWIQNGNTVYWTSVGETWMHPNGTQPSSRQRAVHWSVRRWVSEVNGLINISLSLSKYYPGGDGLTGHLFIDGNELWTQSISGYDSTGCTFSTIVQVQQGALIDFSVDAGNNNNDLYDHASYSAQITLVPEPISVCYLLTGVLALRKRRLALNK